MFDISDVK